MSATTRAGVANAGTSRRGAWKYIAGLLVIAAAVAYILTSSLSSNLTYFITPSEYARDEARYAGRTVRLGGVVEPGTVKYDKSTLQLRFVVSDGTVQFPVVHQGTPPDLFREGTGVTIEGKFDGNLFRGQTLLVKHSEEYRVPQPGEKVDYAKIIQDAR